MNRLESVMKLRRVSRGLDVFAGRSGSRSDTAETIVDQKIHSRIIKTTAIYTSRGSDLNTSLVCNTM